MTDDPLNDEYVAEVERQLANPEPDTAAPEYEWIGPATIHGLGLLTRCECGALVPLKAQADHNRFHSILNDQARAIAVLLSSHLSETSHARYDAYERALVR
jgi:hypothetical protein